MAWYPDESPCDYFDFNGAAAVLSAVGWLERGQPYSTGTPRPDVYERLKELLSGCWQPCGFMGHHECDLCAYEADPLARGNRNLFIPADGILYVCPELIVHYMNAHGYTPPAKFCQFVITCPPMNSMEYRKALLANGGRVLVGGQGL